MYSKLLLFFFFGVAFALEQENKILSFSDDLISDNVSTSTSVKTTPAATTPVATTTLKHTTPKPKDDLISKISNVTWIITGITIFYWFFTLIVAFVLCMKYMGSQKRRALPHPSPEVKLSEREYEEFSEVPDEANYLEKNSKIQGIKNKMGKAVHRNKKGGGAGNDNDDEFAM